MDVNYISTRKRKDFGKLCNFSDMGPSLVVEIDPNPELKDRYVKVSVVDREIDNTPKMCAHEVNTVTYPTESRGMTHMEGGWPATVDNTDDDSMARFRKKIEKDKNYVNTIKSLSEFVENFIMENNSINIYEEYFSEERIKCASESYLSVLNSYHDLYERDRNVIGLNWNMDSTKFVAIYELKKCRTYPINSCIDSYVWNVENNVNPVCILKPEVQMSIAEFSPTNTNLLASGYENGQVALWDTRLSGHSQQMSTVMHSHNEKVTGLKWLKSKEETSFFTVSTDSKIISWDSRNLSSPTETVMLDAENGDFPNLDKQYNVSCVSYDSSVPDNFMVGTEQGTVLSFMRKLRKQGVVPVTRYECQCNTVIAVDRNAYFPQLFGTCDPWSVKLWSQSATNFPVLNIVSGCGYFTGMLWSPARASTLFTPKTSGILEVWDLPFKNKEPLLSIRVDDEALFSVAINETGNHVVSGSASGSVHLVNVPDYLRQSSALEVEEVMSFLKEQFVDGGKPRSKRIVEKEKDSAQVKDLEEWWDPPEKAEDLYEEYKIMFDSFLPDVE